MKCMLAFLLKIASLQGCYSSLYFRITSDGMEININFLLSSTSNLRTSTSFEIMIKALRSKNIDLAMGTFKLALLDQLNEI